MSQWVRGSGSVIMAKLRLIAERFEVTQSIKQFSERVTDRIIDIMLKKVEPKEFMAVGFLSGDVVGPSGNHIKVRIDIEPVKSSKKHFECEAVLHPGGTYGVITIQLNIARKSLDYDRFTIYKLVLHEVVHLFDPGLKFSRETNTHSQYHRSNHEVHAECTAIAEAIVDELLQKHTPDQIKVMISRAGFVDFLVDKIKSGYIKSGAGKFVTHAETYSKSDAMIRKILRYTFQSLQSKISRHEHAIGNNLPSTGDLA